MSKVLPSHLKKVIGRLISVEQSTFILGRSMSDGVVVVNEILDLSKRINRECMVLKIDFERAYDCVSWSFLRYVLRKLNFGDRWLNGSAVKDFEMRNGLRQGDPLSPFIFIIVMEGLTRLIKKEVEKNLFKGFMVNEAISYNVAQFADDTLIVGEGSSKMV